MERIINISLSISSAEKAADFERFKMILKFKDAIIENEIKNLNCKEYTLLDAKIIKNQYVHLYKIIE